MQLLQNVTRGICLATHYQVPIIQISGRFM
jgi:hypothetical protein